jgi:hypothetical protein
MYQLSTLVNMTYAALVNMHPAHGDIWRLHTARVGHRSVSGGALSLATIRDVNIAVPVISATNADSRQLPAAALVDREFCCVGRQREATIDHRV